jgi:hypothetical protein
VPRANFIFEFLQSFLAFLFLPMNTFLEDVQKQFVKNISLLC